MNIALLIFAIALCTPLMRGQLLSSPMNTIAKIGQRVELECSTNATLPLNWDFAEVNSTRFEHIYRNEFIENKFSSRYYVYNISSSVKRHWVLVINSVDIYHAGTYRCENVYEPKVIQMNATAHLVVIDYVPVCDTNASNDCVVEGDYIQMWCKVNYSGNYILVMEWARSDGQPVDTYTHSSRKSSKVTSSLKKELVSRDNNITFTCKTSLNLNTINGIPAAVDITKATNIYYHYSWNYTANVLYGPRNQTISLIDAALKTEIRLECFADGNPAPNFEWEIVGKTIPLNNGPIVLISKSMITEEEQTLRCTAWNYVAGQIKSNEATYTFPLTQTPTSWNSCLIMLTASGVLAVIGLCALGLAVALTVKGCVKDSDPVCGTNASNGGVVEGDYIQMWCRVNYTGNWILVMEWTINRQKPDRPTHNTYGSRRVTSSLIKQLASNDNGITFTCKMSLNPNVTNNLHVPAQVGKTMATNIPHYQYSWNYTANVLYGPRNQTIILIYAAALKTEIRVECFADGNPAPSYEWEIVGKTISFNNGPIVIIGKSMITDEEQTLRCRAWNYVAGQIRNNEATLPFSLTQTPTSWNSCLIMLSASGVLAVIGLCALGLAVALTVKACVKGNSVNRESCKESSVQPQDYEMVDESNMKSGSFGKSSSNPITSKKKGIEHFSTETTASEDYVALNRRSSASNPHPAIYAELQQYANTGRNND